ncbi:MAG: hypothetical protein ACRD3S_19030 [Terracidiphilus sp.]
MKLAHCGLLLLLAAPCAAASAGQSQLAPPQNGQSQTDPLASAARRAREKQKEQPKPAKVWDNDNIPTSGNVDVIGPPAPNSSTETSASTSEDISESDHDSTKSSKTDDKSALEAQLKGAQEALKTAQTRLDFLQRKLSLDQHTYYQNPNYSSDKAGAKALQDEQAQIDANKQDVAAAQKTVDDLTAKVQAAGGKDSSDSATK